VKPGGMRPGRDATFAWTLLLPALVLLAGIAVGPLFATFWESLHHHDLRMPWLGRPFIGLDNYQAALTDQRLRGPSCTRYSLRPRACRSRSSSGWHSRWRSMP
jgi:ABC-type sugar transport system permease subunit